MSARVGAAGAERRPQLSALRRGVAALAGCAVLCGASILWLDRPIARAMHAWFAPGAGWLLARLPAPIAAHPLSMPLLAALLIALALRGRLVSRGRLAGLLLGAFLATLLAKDVLKLAFGRTWPETWFHRNPSFIGDGVYGFHPFHGGVGWSSFPSGHMSVTAALMAVLWRLVPQARWLALAVASFVGIALVALDYHFLSDVIAGAFLGISIGLGCSRMRTVEDDVTQASRSSD